MPPDSPITLRILGLDPALTVTGWGVVDVTGNRVRYVSDGAISTSSRLPLHDRLVELRDGLQAVLDAYTPHEAAVEETFVNKNPTSTLKLGMARGVVLLAPAERGLPIAEYTPNHVKKSVVGSGHAAKEQVQHMVRMMLPGAKLETPDAADALAVALTHAHHAQAARSGIALATAR